VSKEIGIRKVLGASTSGVAALLSRQFMKWVVLANAAAWPVAYAAVTKWLQAFASRIEITVWIFLASGLTALIISFLAIGARTVRGGRGQSRGRPPIRISAPRGGRRMRACKTVLAIVTLFLTAEPAARPQDVFDLLRKGDVSAVKALIEKSPQVLESRDGGGMTPLRYAAIGGIWSVNSGIPRRPPPFRQPDRNTAKTSDQS
jgi:hypothetical protein